MPLLQPPSPLAPRPREGPLWPIGAAGGAGVAAIVALAALERIDGPWAVLALIFTSAATALSLIAADRRAEADATEFAPAVLGPGVEGPSYVGLVDALPDPILVVAASDPDDLTDRRYVFANAAARELLRISRSEGMLVTVVRDPEVLEAVDEALFGGVAGERFHETGGVQPRTFRVHARPLVSGEGGARLALLAFRDETEVRRAERTRADFLANASHELRTPLASLSGFIETLRGHAREDEGARDRFLGIMQAQAERMSRLIDDLMSLSRIELNEHIAPADEVDLAMAVTDVLDAVAPLARERGVGLEARLPGVGQSQVIGDRDQIIQVAQNLVDNALKYSVAGATVTVSVETGLSAEQASAGQKADTSRLSLLTPDHADETYAVLRVADTGAGIAREHLPRLTERFYRVEGQKSSDRAGTGLGLAIVKHIANRHRGGVTVESAEGQGTIFTVYVPQIAATVVPFPVSVAKVS